MKFNNVMGPEFLDRSDTGHVYTCARENCNGMPPTIPSGLTIDPDLHSDAPTFFKLLSLVTSWVTSSHSS